MTELQHDPQLQDAQRFLAMASDHYENFPVASWLMPEPQRTHIRRIYAFARTADDIADEQRDPVALAAYRRTFEAEVGRVAKAEDHPTVSLFRDLHASIQELDLPVDLFLALLDAFASDLTVRRYDEPTLMAYCRKSADPVGRLVLRVFGVATEQRDAWSDSVCTGLQLVNHLQDIGSDYRERDRIYFPESDLQRFGVGEEQLGGDVTTPELRALVRHWSARVTDMFRTGWPLLASVPPGRLRWELRGILRGASAVLDRLRVTDYDVLGSKVHLSKYRRAHILLAAVFSARPPRNFRA